jgi:hypothetical protein
MSWVRLDDNFPNHPKIVGLSDQAFRLYISGLCYASHYLTDGLIIEPAMRRLDGADGVNELVEAGLWLKVQKGWQIASYGEYQTPKSEVEKAKQANRERVNRWKEKQKINGINNELLTDPHTHTNTHTHTHTNINKENMMEVEIPVPRVKTAKEAVERIVVKLSEARKNGINAWNLSRLVEDEWDKLERADDMAGATALTVWYVSELQSRKLESDEISRIAQLTKRFGRLALLAIDKASSKNLDDLVSYSLVVAQNMYEESKKNA